MESREARPRQKGRGSRGNQGFTRDTPAAPGETAGVVGRRSVERRVTERPVVLDLQIINKLLTSRFRSGVLRRRRGLPFDRAGIPMAENDKERPWASYWRFYC